MPKSIGSLLVLVCFSSYAAAQGTLTTSVVVLRNTESALNGENALQDQAVFLNSDGELLHTIEGLGLCQSNSYQSKVVIDSSNKKVYIVEQLSNRISVYDTDGERIGKISIKNPSSITLNVDTNWALNWLLRVRPGCGLQTADL